jgi:hypothetical protein
MLVIQAAWKTPPRAASRILKRNARNFCALFSRPRQRPEATTSLHEAGLAAAFPLDLERM